MQLTFDKLIKFDLEKELEKNASFRGQIPEFLKTIYEIHAADKFIRDCPSYPDSTDTIIRSEMISAIGSTLAIEGGNLGSEEIENSLQKAERQEPLRQSEQEAENSRKVYEGIIDAVGKPNGSFTYTEQIIRQIQKWFTEGLNYMGNAPGQYRAFETQFGNPPRKGLCRTEAEVREAMTNFTSWLNFNDEEFLAGNNIVKAIMGHYYLTEIHPFADGNGRTARALEALLLYANGVNPYCFWSLANFWSLHRSEYIQHLGKIRKTCTPWPFLIWGMKGYLQEIERIKELVLTKMKQLMFQDYVKYLVDNKKINKRIYLMLRLLVQHSPITLDKFRSSPELKYLYSRLSPPTKSRDFKQLFEGDLDLIHFSEKDNKTFIKPNFKILERLKYRV